MNEEHDRYARHRLIDWWDQERLRAGRILVLGAGAIGNAVIEMLALLGVGQIVIVDFDRIERSNLTRSPLFRDEDVGLSKAETAARRARALNPEVDVRAIHGDLEYEVGLGIYRAMDLVITGLDSIGARLAANRACRRTGTPMLNAGIEATFAEIGLYSGTDGPCFECALPEGLWARQAERFSCTGLREDLPPDRTPTTAVVAAVTAGYAVNEAIYLLHRHPEAAKDGLAFGQKLFLTFKPYGFHVLDLPLDSRCLAHEHWEPVAVLKEDPADLTPDALLARLDGPDAELELDFDLLTRMRCVRCGAEEPVMRPLQRCSAGLSRCPICEEETRRPETVDRIAQGSEFASWPLARLGVTAYQILSIRTRDQRHYVQLNGDYT